MEVAFLDIEKHPVALQGVPSHMDSEQSHSQAPTLHNTPSPSRDPSPRPKTPYPGDRNEARMHQSMVPLTVMRRYSRHELDVNYLGSIIIICFFTSGLIDAVAFNSWNCFVGMQTGNTIFAALGLGGLPQAAHSQQYIKSFTAIGSFCLGTLFFNYLHRFPTGLHNQPTSRRRAIFFLSFLVQTILIFIGAALVTTGVVSNRPFEVGTFSSGSQRKVRGQYWQDLVPIAFLAFEAAGQVCLSRVLCLVELPTIVLSTLYHDFTADLYMTRQLWRQSSSFKDFVLVQGRRQEKRLFSIIALFLGGVVGGEMYKSRVGMAGALWFAGTLKGSIMLAFLLWKKEPVEDEEGCERQPTSPKL